MIHVIFCASAAGTFRQLLRTRGINEQVVAIGEELDFGPMSNGPLVNREPWLNQHAPLDFGDRDWLAEAETRVRTQIASDPERLAWISPASAAEQAGLYWYLSQFGGSGLTMAIADFPLAGNWEGKAPLKLGELGVEPMGQLYDESARVPWNPARYPEDRWHALVAENALLRVVNDGRLQSAADTYFDKYLLARCSDEWAKWYRVMAYAMGDIWDTGQSAGSELLLWRIRSLIDDGQIVCDGDLPVVGRIDDPTRIRRANLSSRA